MPRKCCIPFCKSNYASELINHSPVSTFSFPKDPQLRDLWIKAVPRENFDPTKSAAVCGKHFDEGQIIRVDSMKRSDGTILSAPRKNPKLLPDAVPYIFPKQPCETVFTPTVVLLTPCFVEENIRGRHQSKRSPRHRSKWIEREEEKRWLEEDGIRDCHQIKQEPHCRSNLIERDEEDDIRDCHQIKQEPDCQSNLIEQDEENRCPEEDDIRNFVSLKNKILKRCVNFSDFTVYVGESFVCIYKTDFVQQPKITLSIKLNSEFDIEVWNGDVNIPVKTFNWILGPELKITKWSQIETLLSHLSTVKIEVDL